MKLIDQVISFEQAKRLKELGVKYPAGKESFFKWFECDTGEKWEPGLFRPDSGEFDYMLIDGLEGDYSDELETRGNWDAFTLSELSVMLPASITFGKKLACLRMVKSDSCEEYNQPDCYLAGYYTSEKELLKDWVMGNGDDNLVKAAVGMLIMLLEHGKTTVEEVNARLCA